MLEILNSDGTLVRRAPRVEAVPDPEDPVWGGGRTEVLDDVAVVVVMADMELVVVIGDPVLEVAGVV
jgi:hypothetical protein